MLFYIIKLIKLIIPYGLLLLMYRNNEAIPANIRTRSGRNLKAIMITENYGIIVSKSKYIDNRAKILMQEQKRINAANEKLAKQFNTLSFDMREEIFSKPEVGEYND